MGGQPSKEESRYAVVVKGNVETHRSNVRAIGKAIDAQTDIVEQLVHLIADSQQEDYGNDQIRPRKEIIKTTKNLQANIQNILILQSCSLSSSFDVLDNCLKDIIEHSRLSLGYSVDTQEQRLVDSETHHHKERETCEQESSGGRIAGSEHAHSYKEVLQEEGKGLHESLANTKRVKELLEENGRLVAGTRELQHALNDKQVNIRKSQVELDQLQTKYTKQGQEMERLRTELRYNKEASAKRWQTETDNRRLQGRVEDLERQVRGMELMKHRKKSIPIQLYYQRRGELMTMVVEELSAMLNTHMNTSRSIELDIKRCENTSDIQPDKPLLILCINASRLGTDAAAAIQGTQQSGRTALLIFHHKNIHALPSQPSDRMLTAPEFKALGGIYDLAFLTGKGIYSCNMNEIAITGIEHFIQQTITGQS